MTIIRPNNPLPTRDAAGMAEIGDITGLAERGQIIFNDDFKTGPQGFGLLYAMDSSDAGNGKPSFISVPMFWLADRHRPRLELRGSDISGLKGMLIKRSKQLLGYGFYLQEFLVAIHVSSFADPRVTLSPSRVDFVLDTAQADGKRQYINLRYAPNYAGLTAGSWSILTDNTSGSASVLTEVGVYTPASNENKVLPVRVAFLVNTATGKYHGVQVDDQLKVGALNGNLADTTLSDLAPAQGPTLGRFAGGLNPSIEMAQATGSSFTEAVVELLHHRLTYLGTSLS